MYTYIILSRDVPFLKFDFFLKPRPNGQTLFDKHLKFYLSRTMFAGLATTQTGAWQTFFACDKQKVFLKSFKNIEKQNVLVKQCLSWWPNGQACLTSKVRNVCQTMFVRLAEALRLVLDGILRAAEESNPRRIYMWTRTDALQIKSRASSFIVLHRMIRFD